MKERQMERETVTHSWIIYRK